MIDDRILGELEPPREDDEYESHRTREMKVVRSAAVERLELIEWSTRSKYRWVRGIYVIVNVATRDRYVGKTENITARIEQHRQHIKSNCRIDMPRMWADLEQHGIDSFRFGVIERVAEDVDLDEREAYWWRRLQPYYNMQGCEYPRSNWSLLLPDVQSFLRPFFA